MMLQWNSCTVMKLFAQGETAGETGEKELEEEDEEGRLD